MVADAYAKFTFDSLKETAPQKAQDREMLIVNMTRLIIEEQFQKTKEDILKNRRSILWIEK